MLGDLRILLLGSFIMSLALSCRTPREEVEILAPSVSKPNTSDDPNKVSMQSNLRISKLDPKPKSFNKVKLTLRLLDVCGKSISAKSYADYTVDTAIGITPNAWYNAEIEVYQNDGLVAENKSCCRIIRFKSDYGEISKIGKLCPFDSTSESEGSACSSPPPDRMACNLKS